MPTRTDAEARQAANETVAVFMGYGMDMMPHWWQEQGYPKMLRKPIDLFAATDAGAGYREQVRGKLLEAGFQIDVFKEAKSFFVRYERDEACPPSWGATLIEAEAWAMVRAVEAMAAEKEGDRANG